MASIKNPIISASKSSTDPNNWVVTVEYDAVFSAFELANFTFRDGFVLFEEDDTSADDQLTNVAAVTVFNPSKSPTHRKMSLKMSTDALDTEWGDEELFAQVRLRNIDLNMLQTRNTAILVIAP